MLEVYIVIILRMRAKLLILIVLATLIPPLKYIKKFYHTACHFPLYRDEWSHIMLADWPDQEINTVYAMLQPIENYTFIYTWDFSRTDLFLDFRCMEHFKHILLISVFNPFGK